MFFIDVTSVYERIINCMGSSRTVPAHGQILVDIEDMSLLKDIKKAISMLKGVGKITMPRRKGLSAYERSL